MFLIPTTEQSCLLDHFLTFHDLLQLHLQGLDGPHRILTSLPVHPVDGQLPAGHHCDVVILHVQHFVGVLNDGTVGTDETDGSDQFRRISSSLMFAKGAKLVSHTCY